MGTHIFNQTLNGLRRLLILSTPLAAAAAMGCSDGDTAATGPSTVASPSDRDGGTVASRPDATVTATGNPDTQLTTVDGLALCEYDAMDRLSVEGHPGYSGKGTAAVPDGLALTFQGPLADVRLLAVPSEGELGEPVAAVAGADGPRDPSLVANDESMLLLWRQPGADGDTRLWLRTLSDPHAAAVQVGGALATFAAGGPAYAVIGRADDFVVAYLPVGDGGLELVTVGADGTAGEVVSPLSKVAAADIAGLGLARLDDGQVLLAWLSPAEEHYNVHGQLLTADLEASGATVDLSSRPVTEGPLGLAGRTGTAGLIYQTQELAREAIKFRPVNADGSLGGALLNIETAPGRAINGDIAAFGQGYVVGYRTLRSPGHPEPTIRLSFINEFGVVVHAADLADTTEEGGDVTLAATLDGRLVVSWSDQSPSGLTSIEGARLYCPGALVLCGGGEHLQ